MKYIFSLTLVAFLITACSDNSSGPIVEDDKQQEDPFFDATREERFYNDPDFNKIDGYWQAHLDTSTEDKKDQFLDFVNDWEAVQGVTYGEYYPDAIDLRDDAGDRGGYILSNDSIFYIDHNIDYTDPNNLDTLETKTTFSKTVEFTSPDTLIFNGVEWEVFVFVP